VVIEPLAELRVTEVRRWYGKRSGGSPLACHGEGSAADGYDEDCAEDDVQLGVVVRGVRG
jgi:hypothetical protein